MSNNIDLWPETFALDGLDVGLSQTINNHENGIKNCSLTSSNPAIMRCRSLSSESEDEMMKPESANVLDDDTVLLDDRFIQNSTTGAMMMGRRTTGKPIGVFKPMHVSIRTHPSREYDDEKLDFELNLENKSNEHLTSLSAQTSPSNSTTTMNLDSILRSRSEAFLFEDSQFNILNGSFTSTSTSSENQTMKRGVLLSDCAIKEVIAYRLDHGRSAGVPRTAAVIMTERQKLANDWPSPACLGSFQEFQEHLCSAEDLGSSLFSIEDVHRIGLFDVRMCNLDRHLGNLLVKKVNAHDYRLIPIDHGFILPTYRCLSDVWFCWAVWKQSTIPFSDELKEWVKNNVWDPIAVLEEIADLSHTTFHSIPASSSSSSAASPPLTKRSMPIPMNPSLSSHQVETKFNPSFRRARDLIALHRLGLRPQCILTYLLCTIFEREMVAANRTLFDMARAMQRNVNELEQPCGIERLIERAIEHSDLKQGVDKVLADAKLDRIQSRSLLVYDDDISQSLNGESSNPWNSVKNKNCNWGILSFAQDWATPPIIEFLHTFRNLLLEKIQSQEL